MIVIFVFGEVDNFYSSAEKCQSFKLLFLLFIAKFAIN